MIRVRLSGSVFGFIIHPPQDPLSAWIPFYQLGGASLRASFALTFWICVVFAFLSYDVSGQVPILRLIALPRSYQLITHKLLFYSDEDLCDAGI